MALAMQPALQLHEWKSELRIWDPQGTALRLWQLFVAAGLTDLQKDEQFESDRELFAEFRQLPDGPQLFQLPDFQRLSNLPLRFWC